MQNAKTTVLPPRVRGKDLKPRKKRTPKKSCRVSLSTRIDKKSRKKIDTYLSKFPEVFKSEGMLLDAMISNFRHRGGVEL